jgi:hypothetical protein
MRQVSNQIRKTPEVFCIEGTPWWLLSTEKHAFASNRDPSMGSRDGPKTIAYPLYCEKLNNWVEIIVISIIKKNKNSKEQKCVNLGRNKPYRLEGDNPNHQTNYACSWYLLIMEVQIRYIKTA